MPPRADKSAPTSLSSFTYPHSVYNVKEENGTLLRYLTVSIMWMEFTPQMRFAGLNRLDAGDQPHYYRLKRGFIAKVPKDHDAYKSIMPFEILGRFRAIGSCVIHVVGVKCIEEMYPG